MWRATKQDLDTYQNTSLKFESLLVTPRSTDLALSLGETLDVGVKRLVGWL